MAENENHRNVPFAGFEEAFAPSIPSIQDAIDKQRLGRRRQVAVVAGALSVAFGKYWNAVWSRPGDQLVLFVGYRAPEQAEESPEEES